LATPSPHYVYPGQWMDELGSLANTASQTPRTAVDLQMNITDPDALNAISGSLFDSQTPPY
jgi:hypothetical protein